MNIAFIIYGEPTAKGRPRFARRGRFMTAYTPKETEIAENNFRAQALRFKPPQPIIGPVSLDIVIYRSIPQSKPKKWQELAAAGHIKPVTKPDWDNYAKLVCDAMNSIFWHDDSQVVSCYVRKMYSEQPRIEIVVEELNNV